MNELQPESSWSSLAVCALACGLASLFAHAAEVTLLTRANACGQAACAGVIAFCFLGDQFPFGIVLGFCVIMGISGPEFMRRLLSLAQKGLMGAAKSVFGNFGNKQSESNSNETRD